MNQYKTVKEVCALTGLTRKHLYYFHHENIVRAVTYANYSVEGNDGYKLYDDAAVEKLQQIALYYQLGLKRQHRKVGIQSRLHPRSFFPPMQSRLTVKYMFLKALNLSIIQMAASR